MSNLPAEVAALLHHGAASTTSISRTIGRSNLDHLLSAGVLLRSPDAHGAVLYPPEVDRFTPFATILLRCRGGAVACRSACWYYQATPFDTAVPAHIDILATTRSRVPDVRYTSELLPCDVVLFGGLRVTSPPRTLADLGSIADDDIVERAVERMLYRGTVTEAELWDTADRLKQHGRKGPAALLRILRRRGAGTPPTESDLETRFLQASRALGFPEPTHRQYPIRRWGRDPLRSDFAWRTRQTLVLVEVDGAAIHANPDALVADLRRQNDVQTELRDTRFVMLRFTAEEVDRQPRHIANALSPWLPRAPLAGATQARTGGHGQVHGVAPHFGHPAA
jgi:very-short-patch-repair endonuclease